MRRNYELAANSLIRWMRRQKKYAQSPLNERISLEDIEGFDDERIRNVLYLQAEQIRTGEGSLVFPVLYPDDRLSHSVSIPRRSLNLPMSSRVD